MVEHVAPSPFPFTKDGRVLATDEECLCRHRRSKHEDAAGGYAYGHGACGQCDCPKFTWRRFVTS